MIAEITFKNFYSFRDETTFSFEADNEKELEEFHVVEVEPGVRLLKVGIIYGANASGKSNVLNVWEFFREFFASERIIERNDPIPYLPFKLDNKSTKENSEFSLTFYIKNKEGKYIKYIYSLVVCENKVISEVLHAYLSIQPTAIFERTMEQGISVIKFSPKLKVSTKIRDEISLRCLPNISVFSAYRRVNAHILELERVNQYLENKLLFGVVGPKELLPRYVPLTSNDQKENILQFLKEADFNITDIKENDAESNLPYGTGEEYLYTHKVVGEDNDEVYYTFPDAMESEGTLQTFKLSSYIYEVIKKNSFLVIDEIESSLHPKLVEFLLIKFLKESMTEQLLFTTHYDGLLSEEDIIRKDNIWFTAKNREGVSELYPLTDFRGLGRISSLQKAYKMGKFGGVPNI